MFDLFKQKNEEKNNNDQEIYLNKSLNQIESIDKTLEENNSRLNKIEEKLNNSTSYEQNLKTLNNSLKDNESKLSILEEKIKKYDSYDLTKIETSSNLQKDNDLRLNALEDKLDQLTSLNLDDIENMLDNLNKNMSKLNELEKSINSFIKENEAIHNQQDKLLESYHSQLSMIFLYCDLKTKGPLRNFQVFNQVLLDFVVNVCKKHKLDYWLDYGTLLGAVRHGGYIPWDDDIDIGMMRKDYNKFIKIFQDEINSHNLQEDITFSVNERYTAAGWKVSFLQIMYLSHKKHMLAGMDIFPYDFIKNPSETLEDDFNKEQKVFIQKMRDGVDIMAYLDDYFKKFDISMNKEDYIIPGIDCNVRGKLHGYPFVLMDTDMVYPLTKIKFNNNVYACPNNTDPYLKEIYGDYMSIPKIIVDHNRAKLLQKEYDDNYYSRYMTKLRKINENFS